MEKYPSLYSRMFTSRTQPWDQHPGEEREGSWLPHPHHGSSCHCSLKAATISTSQNPFATNNDLSTFPQFLTSKADLGDSFLSYFSRLRRETIALSFKKYAGYKLRQ